MFFLSYLVKQLLENGMYVMLWGGEVILFGEEGNIFNNILKCSVMQNNLKTFDMQFLNLTSWVLWWEQSSTYWTWIFRVKFTAGNNLLGKENNLLWGIAVFTSWLHIVVHKAVTMI
jgi:hypothetical protein